MRGEVEGVSDDAHQHGRPPLMVLVFVDRDQVGTIDQGTQRLEQDSADHSSQHVPPTGSHRKDGGAGMEATVPQEQALFQAPALQPQRQAAGFPLATRTDFRLADQMGPTFDQEQQPRLGKGAVRELVIGAVAKGFSIARRIGHRGDPPIDGEQTQAFPEGSQCLGRGFGPSTAHKEFLQELAAHLAAPIAKGRPDGDGFCNIITCRSQTTDHFPVDPPLGEVWIQMQGDQPRGDRNHIRLLFALFPHLVGVQQLFDQAGRDHARSTKPMSMWWQTLSSKPFSGIVTIMRRVLSLFRFAMASVCHWDRLFVCFFPVLPTSYC